MAFYISMFVVWVIVMIIAIWVEIETIQQVGFAFAIAAFGALITHAVLGLGDLFWVEFLVFGGLFVITWIVLIAIFKNISKGGHDTDDGVLKFPGMKVKVIASNEKEFGLVEVEGKEFRFQFNEVIPIGEIVTIKEVKGNTMIIERGK